jgi:hypothetical protein
LNRKKVLDLSEVKNTRGLISLFPGRKRMERMTEGASVPPTIQPAPTRFLRPREIAFIEDALRQVGAFGEVHLIVERGRLRFVRTLKSEAIDSSKDKPS